MNTDPCKLEISIDGVKEDTKSEYERLKGGYPYRHACDVYAYMRVRIPGTWRDGHVFMRKVLLEALANVESQIGPYEMAEIWRKEHKGVPKSWFIGAAKDVLARPDYEQDFLAKACLELLLEILEKS
jgi:hypothetical protein